MRMDVKKRKRTTVMEYNDKGRKKTRRGAIEKPDGMTEVLLFVGNSGMDVGKRCPSHNILL